MTNECTWYCEDCEEGFCEHCENPAEIIRGNSYCDACAEKKQKEDSA